MKYNIDVIETLLQLNTEQRGRLIEIKKIFSGFFKDQHKGYYKGYIYIYTYDELLERIANYYGAPFKKNIKYVINKRYKNMQDFFARTRLFFRYDDILKIFCEKDILKYISDFASDDPLIKYIEENKHLTSIMLENVEQLKKINVFSYRPGDKNITFDPQANLDKDYCFRTFYSTDSSGIISDGNINFKVSLNREYFPCQLKNANIVIEYGFDQEVEKITIKNLTFKRFIPERPLESYFKKPDIPYDFYNEIEEQLEKLVEELKEKENYKKSLEKAKENFQLVKAYPVTLANAQEIAQLLNEEYQQDIKEFALKNQLSASQVEEKVDNMYINQRKKI